MKLKDDEIKNVIETINKEINSVTTTLIEVICPQHIPMQSWHHYDTAVVEYESETEEIFFSFYTNDKRTSGFATKFEAIKLYRLLDIPDLSDLGKHYHILASDKSVKIEFDRKEKIVSVTRRKDYPLFIGD